MALAFGWRATFVAVAALGVALVAVAQLTRARFDGDARPGHRLSVAGLFEPLKVVLGHRALVVLSITGCVYALMQVSFLSFLVVYLTESLGLSLVAAGFALTVANLGGMAGRIGWGAVADRFVAPRTTLGMIGVASGACAYATAAFGTGWPTAALLAVCALFGATAIGWNGVQLAQVARHAPPGQAGAVTGASGFLTFMGVVLGPPLFALLAGATGSYRVGFAVFGTLTLLCGVGLLVTRRD